MSASFVILAIILVIAVVGAVLAAATLFHLARMTPAGQQDVDASLALFDKGLRDELARGNQATQTTLIEQLAAWTNTLNGTLSSLQQSFGEVRGLGSVIEDVKRILVTPKTRGIVGEVALGGVLEQALSPGQFLRNVEVRPRSGERVEYAIVLPGDEESPVLLPVDAKFPIETYERLLDAERRGDSAVAASAARAIEGVTRNAAKDIAKYIAPPHTTEFAVMYLATEGLFKVVAERPGLVDTLQREFHVMVAGPTTLWGLVMGLRMGLRTLGIRRHSNEVWKLLSAFKTEFGKFNEVIARLLSHLIRGQKIVEDEVNPRLRVMSRTLDRVEAMPESDATELLGLPGTVPGQADD